MDILVSEIVTRQRLIGDRRLSDALAQCDAWAGTRCRWRPRSWLGSSRRAHEEGRQHWNKKTPEVI
jgi:hypothetical protein